MHAQTNLTILLLRRENIWLLYACTYVCMNGWMDGCMCVCVFVCVCVIRLQYGQVLPKRFFVSQFHWWIHITVIMSLYFWQDRFLIRCDNRWGLCLFGTDENLAQLRTCTIVYLDATYKTCPHPYNQIFSILGRIQGGHVVPLVYALMTQKTIGHYRQVWFYFVYSMFEGAFWNFWFRLLLRLLTF